MTPLDRTLLLQKISRLETYYNHVSEYCHISRDDYLKDWKVQCAIERSLQIMIKICSDISIHLLLTREIRPSASDNELFKELHKNSLISRDMVDIMEHLVKFSTYFTYSFEEVNHDIIMTILNDHLKNFILFRDNIVNVIEMENQ